MIQLTLKLPPFEGECNAEVLGKMPALCETDFEPVGRWFEAFCLRQQHKHGLSQSNMSGASTSDESSDDEALAEEEDDVMLLQTLNPKEWKDQDHYAVLGLSKLRYKATEEQIKKAYKNKVLRHHPDKRRARGLPVKEGEEDYFTCITRAWEVLGIPGRKRAYDSVDPEFDNMVPNVLSDNKDKFFENFAPVFERNSRWSVKQPVPVVGDENSTFDRVDRFYSFWYEFDSWREYSYLDEEEKEKGENRDERRWIDKQNKAARAKRKKEEVARIRQLVDNAYNSDPRLERWKTDEKNKKQQEKQAKKDAQRRRQEEEDRKRHEEEEATRKEKEKQEEERKLQAAAAKKEREEAKKALKKERELLNQKAREFDYFAATDDEKVDHMKDVDRLCELLSLTSLQGLNQAMSGTGCDQAKEVFLKEVAALDERLGKEQQELMEKMTKQGTKSSESKREVTWTEKELAALIKGVNLFPAGTVKRWETVASFITQHVPTSNRSAKDVLNKAKELQTDSSMKEEANKKAFEKFNQNTKTVTKVDESEVSQRYVSVTEAQLIETGSNPAPWTPEEQKLLEQGLKTYGNDVPDRWDKIATNIPSRSKKDCMKRYKELAELIRAKKLAQVEAQKKGKK